MFQVYGHTGILPVYLPYLPPLCRPDLVQGTQRGETIRCTKSVTPRPKIGVPGRTLSTCLLCD